MLYKHSPFRFFHELVQNWLINEALFLTFTIHNALLNLLSLLLLLVSSSYDHDLFSFFTISWKAIKALNHSLLAQNIFYHHFQLLLNFLLFSLLLDIFLCALCYCFYSQITAGDLSTASERNLESKGSMGRSKKLTCLFPFSDLRRFEFEKDKNDESSPRGVLEACNNDLENEAASKTQPSAPENHRSNSWASHRWHRFWKLWKGPKMNRFPSFPPLAVPKISKRKSMSSREHVENLCPIKSAWKNFTLSDLRSATNNFSQENLIGKGGYAVVYRGCLPNGQLVAIKQLNRGTSEEQTISFLSEVGIIAHVNHRNTAKMVGYGVEGGTYLVLQLSSLGSLGSLLRGSKETLNWGVRYKIIQGTANGLLYLHENCQRRIIHRDIKSDNILLTEDFEPQICDFGLAKWLPNQWTHHHVSKFEGTFGYFAPEYFMHGIVDEKTDVFAFGVLLLEIITGRQALDESQISLVLWAKPLLNNNDLKELIDPSLGNSYNPDEMDLVVLAASLCIEDNPILRPRMSQVVKVLRGGNNYSECPREHRKKFLQRTYSEELLDAEEYNSTRHLSELGQKLKEITLSP